MSLTVEVRRRKKMPALGYRDLEKEKFWREKIAAWRKSRQNKTEFCRQEGLKLYLFCNWEKRIKERDEDNRKAKRRARYRDRKAVSTANEQPLFVPVIEVGEQTVSQALPTDDMQIEIVAPGSGVVVRVGQRFDRDALVRVLGAVKEVSC